MQYTPFGRTGLKVSRLAFGAGPIGYLGSSQEQAEKVLNLLLDRGVNLIDTAAAYLGSEELIGKAVGHRRDDYLLVSKCGRRMEIALRFTLAEPRVHVLSVGTTSPANAEANLAMLEAGPLPAAAVARIRQAFREAQSRAGEPWPALT